MYSYKVISGMLIMFTMILSCMSQILV